MIKSFKIHSCNVKKLSIFTEHFIYCTLQKSQHWVLLTPLLPCYSFIILQNLSLKFRSQFYFLTSNDDISNQHFTTVCHTIVLLCSQKGMNVLIYIKWIPNSLNIYVCQKLVGVISRLYNICHRVDSINVTQYNYYQKPHLTRVYNSIRVLENVLIFVTDVPLESFS